MNGQGRLKFLFSLLALASIFDSNSRIGAAETSITMQTILMPSCDGHVGMWGHSYMGSVQWLTACTGAPLDALAPSGSCPYFYYNVYNQGGAIFLAGVRAGFGANVYGPPPSAGASPHWKEWYL